MAPSAGQRDLQASDFFVGARLGIQVQNVFCLDLHLRIFVGFTSNGITAHTGAKL